MRPRSPNVAWSLYRGDDRRDAIEVLTQGFCHGDPVEAALSITPDEFRVMIGIEIDAIRDDDLSVISRDAQTARARAVAIAVDAASEPVDSCAPASAKFDPIARISRILDERYRAGRSIAPGTDLYVFAVGVLPSLMRRGLGRAIIGAVLRNARERGYATAHAMTTNLASRRLFEGFGFEFSDGIRYQEYRHDGRAVFASVVDDPSVDIMVCPDLRAIDLSRAPTLAPTASGAPKESAEHDV